METKFNFKSSPCTSREQSKRLLALGLKPETADMCWTKMAAIRGTFYVPELAPMNMVSWRHTPAWSLHRLIEMYVERYLSCSVNIKDLTYDWIINEIEIRVKEGYFNKEYLV